MKGDPYRIAELAADLVKAGKVGENSVFDRSRCSDLCCPDEGLEDTFKAILAQLEADIKDWDERLEEEE